MNLFTFHWKMYLKEHFLSNNDTYKQILIVSITMKPCIISITNIPITLRGPEDSSKFLSCSGL